MGFFNQSGKKNESPIPDYIERFKSLLSVRLPFYGEIFSHVEFIRNDSVPTIGTNGKIIIYNDGFLRSVSVPKRNYILMHELMHIILKHWKRDAERNPGIWNLAADYVVNDMLDKCIVFPIINDLLFAAPEGRMHLDEYDDEPVEDLYYKILSNPKNYRKDLRTVMRDIYIIEPLSPADEEMWESELNDAISKSAGKYCSKGGWNRIPPYCLSLVVSRLLPWKRILKEYLSSFETEDISYTTPERKYIHMDLILPGYGKDEEIKLQNIWAFVDASGSISPEEMNEFITQLFRISTDFKAVLNIVYWHSGIADVYRDVNNKELCTATPTSSGGTNPECIYRFLDENKIDPTVMLILTDGVFDTVDEEIVGKRNRKTILVISEEGFCFHDSMGKITRLY